jgi:hypothetical protein
MILNLIGLPGRDQQTERWLQKLLASLAVAPRTTRVLHYRHWDSDGAPDPTGEAARAGITAGDLVIAKSMGTLVLAQSCLQGLRPRAAVLIGVPVRHVEAEVRGALQALANECACLFIQQTNDFTGPFAELASLLDCSAATLVEVPGEDHVYADTDELQSIINSWLHDAVPGVLTD